jgi:hypothetical protein
VSRDRYEVLNPSIGERLYVRPKKLRVFVASETQPTVRS